jgi:N-methylhydantoinase A
MNMPYRLGVDVGGTFTDLLLIDQETGEMVPVKTPSTPHDQSEGVLNGIKELARITDIDPKEIVQILHGTTVATNAALEGKGAKVGLIVTEGYRNMLHLARSWTPGPLFGWMNYEKPEPLAPLELTAEAKERVDANGNIVTELDEDNMYSQILGLLDKGIEAITICLINSYINPIHERRIKEIVKELNPELPISISSDILTEFKEYERTLTTVMNSYVKPKMQLYLSNFEKNLKVNEITSSLNIVRSDGGLMSVSAAGELPVHTMLSGPSGGVEAAAYLGKQIGKLDLLTFDMGGTSTDVSLIRNGEATITRQTQVGSFPVKSPSVNVVSIGAGGGSIAHVPEVTGALRVGPQSAGAVPGPACYGRGGTEPTVSDANAVLGRLPKKLLDGNMELDLEKAYNAVKTVAEPLGMDVFEAAQGIINIVNENMFGALRVVSVEQGLDPRNFSLVGFGGAGPLHANSLGVLTGAYPVIIPHEPGVLSALGFNTSDYKNEFARTSIHKLNEDELDVTEVISNLEELGNEALRWFEEENISAEKRKLEYYMDLRYYRQGFEIPITVTIDDLVRNGFENIIKGFHEVHERLYNFKMDVDVEMVNLRVVAVGKINKPALLEEEKEGTDSSAAILLREKVYFDGAFIDTPIYKRSLLKAGNIIEGPAIVTQYDTTTVILPDHVAEIDEYLNILINPQEEF